MAGIPGRHDAVKEVHPTVDAFNDVGGCAHPHEVPGLVCGHMGLYCVDDVVHHLGLLPYRQTSDGVAVAGKLCNLIHVPHPQVLIGTALVDPKEHLAGVEAVRGGDQLLVLRHTPLQPPERPLTGGLYVVVGGWVLHTLVKGHGDIAAQVGLDAHGLLRPHEDPAAVDVGGEGDPLLRDLPQAG